VVACSYFTLLLATLVSCAYLRVSPSPKLWVGCLLLVSSVQFPRDLAVCMAKRAFVLGVQMQKREYAWRKLFALTAR